MAILLTDNFSLRSGAVDTNGTLMLLAEYDPSAKEDVPHTCILVVNDHALEDKVLLKWQSSCVRALAPGTFIVLGEFGDYLLYENGKQKIGNVFTESRFDRQGVMRAGAVVNNGDVFWVGMSGLAFRRRKNEGWVSIQEGLPSDVDLEGIVVSNSGEVFAYGWKGHVFQFQEQTWLREDIPTNVILTCGSVTSSSNVFIGGQNGTILRGHKNDWRIIAIDTINEDLWGMCWFEDKLYVSTMSFIYILDDEDISLVQYDDQFPETCHHLISNKSDLWSIGAKDLFRRKAQVWEKIELPNLL